MYPLQEDFGRGPVSKIPRQHHETVSKILNNIVGIGCEVVKTADPSAANPWKIVIDLSAIQGGASLPNQNESTAGKFLKSTGASGAEVWDGITGAVPEGGNEGDILTNNGSGAAFWAPPSDTLPEGGNVGDVLTREGDGTAWMPPADGLPEHDAPSALKTLRSTGVTAPAWDWIRPDQLQSVQGPADDFHIPLSTSILTEDGRPYFVSDTPSNILAQHIGVFGSLTTVYRNLLHLRNVNGSWIPQWAAVNVLTGTGTNGDIAVWGAGALTSDSLPNLLRTKITSASTGRPAYLRQKADGNLEWEDICDNVPIDGRLAIIKVSGSDIRIHSSGYPENDEAYVAAVVSVFLNTSPGDILYNSGSKWEQLKTATKSRYMVLQLDANRLPTWDYLRAY